MFVYQVCISYRLCTVDVKTSDYVVRAESMEPATSRALRQFDTAFVYDKPDIISTHTKLVEGVYLD
jgi:hypothetical protein